MGERAWKEIGNHIRVFAKGGPGGESSKRRVQHCTAQQVCCWGSNTTAWKAALALSWARENDEVIYVVEDSYVESRDCHALSVDMGSSRDTELSQDIRFCDPGRTFPIKYPKD